MFPLTLGHLPERSHPQVLLEASKHRMYIQAYYYEGGKIQPACSQCHAILSKDKAKHVLKNAKHN